MSSTIAKHEVLLSVSNVSVAFDGKEIIKDINFNIRNIVKSDEAGQGQVAVLLGKSGIGKSTLFNVLAGLNEPTTGTVLVNQTQTPVKAGDMGVVFQDYYIFTWCKVGAILNMAVKKNPAIPVNERKNAVTMIAEQFDLQQHLEKYSHQLSGGQRQRVSIAEQVLNGGNFILLDEPFSGLDIIMIDKVVNTMLKVSTSDDLKTLIIVSHDLSNSLAIADTVFILNKADENKGATIVKEIDLIERGLCYQPNIKDLPAFRELLKEVKDLMK